MSDKHKIQAIKKIIEDAYDYSIDDSNGFFEGIVSAIDSIVELED